jgi:outer membrane biosynthesis protein TonB
MSVQVHAQSVFWLDQDEQDRFWSRLKRTLFLSLTLHLGVLVVAAGLRLPQRGERPLASVEVSLVSIPAPTNRTDTAKPVPSPPRPVPVPKRSAESIKSAESKPAPAHQAIPEPVPQAGPQPTAEPNPALQAALEAVKRAQPKSVPIPLVAPLKPDPIPVVPPPRQSVAKDILRDLELPPEAPKFGDLAPTKSVDKPRPATKAKVPDLPRVPDMASEQTVNPPRPAVEDVPQEPSLSERLSREFQEELSKVKQFQPAAKLEIPKEAPVKPVPQLEASVPAAATTPQTMLKTSGSSGTNPYWARIEAIIKSHWEPPPIDVGGRTYSVVVKFRFYRNGTVKDVGIQQTSGSGYFDMAGQRAVLKQRQYPPFPSDMPEAYQDVEMVFRVGEAAG